jgi:peptidoglycan/LPS O-acetylase OafA/YrhL
MVFRPFIAPRFDWAAKICAEDASKPETRGQDPRPSPSPEGEGTSLQPSNPDREVELPRGHLPALDAVRGLAIVAVTLYRFGGGAGGAASAVEHSWLVDLGARGVDLFFVLSGFLITGILFDAKGKANYFRDFYARRALRIFPLYYAALAVTLFLLPLFGGSVAAAFQPAVENQAWLWLYGANVLQALRGEWCLGPLNHFWSLAIEEHFYLVWPLVIYCSSRRAAMWICGGVVCFSVAGRACWLASGGNDVAAEVFTPLRMDGLALGSWLALVARAQGGLGWLKRYAPAALVAFGAAALATTVLERRFYGLPCSAWGCTCGALLVLIVAARQESLFGKLAHSRVLRFFGKYSYGIYVFQLPLISIAAGFVSAQELANLLGSALVGHLVYCALLFEATTAAAVVSWVFFENQWLALKRYFE